MLVLAPELLAGGPERPQCLTRIVITSGVGPRDFQATGRWPMDAVHVCCPCCVQDVLTQSVCCRLRLHCEHGVVASWPIARCNLLSSFFAAEGAA